ncbi:MAG: isoprenylcysteine carboxylmethyltransferase family protein [Anaerolineales bacterium]|nr:isoprenylcysteine carboxylmethyltransferase family protein [Anaerolineales bacterium]
MSETRTHSDALRRLVIILFFLGLLSMAILALGIGWACADWGKIRLGWLNQLLGPALTVGGLALVSWSVRIQYVLGKGTPAPKVAAQSLVTQGPYAYSRNPMTLGALSLYLGIGVWMGSGVIIILALSVFSALLTFIYIHETRELRERFGEEYLEYKRRTPFLWPCLTMRK